MKTYFNYLKTYIGSHFNWKLYLATALFLSFFISLNYYLDFEKEYINKGWYKTETRMFWFFLVQIFPYLSVCFFIYLFTETKSFIRKRGFWLTLIFAFAVIGFDRGFYYDYFFADDLAIEVHRFCYRVLHKYVWIVTMFIPFYLFYRFYDKKNQDNFYGFSKEHFTIVPYVIMFCIMIPLVVAASYTDSFLKTYPLYERSGGDEFAMYYGLDRIVSVFTFELSYGIDFFSVELFFRGFLIYAFQKYLGKEVVLPMVATYAFLHFGKPMGETISSIFGGYILGVISLYSRNIWGGVIIHMGVALLMDFCALWQKGYFD